MKLILSASLLTAPALAKSPVLHSHHSTAGGQVLMFGDDHVEVHVKGKNRLVLLFSNKARDPLAPGLFQYEVAVVDGDKRIPLVLKETEKIPWPAEADLPANLSPKAKLEIKAPRRVPEKGSVTVNRTQTLEVSKLPQGH